MLEGNNSALNARQLALRRRQSDFHCQCRRPQWSSASSTQWYEKQVHCIACKPHNPLTLSSFTQLNKKWQGLITWTAARRAVKATAVLARIAYLQVIKWRRAGGHHATIDSGSVFLTDGFFDSPPFLRYPIQKNSYMYSRLQSLSFWYVKNIQTPTRLSRSLSFKTKACIVPK